MDQKEKSLEALEANNKVAIDKEDAIGILEFFTRFNIPMADELRDAVTLFQEEQNLLNYNKLKYSLLKTIDQSEHELFKDEAFDPLKEDIRKVVYDMAFNETLEKNLKE